MWQRLYGLASGDILPYNNVRRKVAGMVTKRLEVRLDRERQRKLQKLADTQGSPVSEVVRRMIDKEYDVALEERRSEAAREIGRMQVEDVPDPETLGRQLEGAYEPGDLP